MNFKKTLIYLLLSIFALIFVYNYVLPFLALQSYNANNMGMSMGMHMREGITNNVIYTNSGLGNIIAAAIVILVTLLMLDKFILSTKNNKCKKCGLTIESDSWRICPRCGNHLSHREEE